MSNNILRVGIVGSGKAAERWHIPAYISGKNATIAAICDSNVELAATVAGRYGISHFYSSVPDMLNREKLDILDICVPHAQHASLALQGIKAGCHILVEKPIAANIAEADEMIETSQRYGKKVCVIHNRLFHPVVMQAIALANSGAIGTFKGIEIRDGLRFDHESLVNKTHWTHNLTAGVFSEFLPHAIYIAQKFIGKFEHIELSVRKTRPESWLIADELRVLTEGKLGLAVIIASCNSPRNTNTLDIWGSLRHLHVDVYNSLLISEGTGREGKPWRGLDNINKAYQHVACTVTAAAKALTGRNDVGHKVLIKQFVQSILKDTPSPVPAEEGRLQISDLAAVEQKIRNKL